MDAQNVTYPNVETALHRDEANGLYLFGVVLHGEFIPLVSHKLGRIDKHLENGRKREAANPPPALSAEQPQQPSQ